MKNTDVISMKKNPLKNPLKTPLILAGAVVFNSLLSTAVMAQCNGCWWPIGNTTTLNGATMCCALVNNVSNSVSPLCDGNDKTPSEAAQCKLDYWRKQEESAKNQLENVQKELDHAHERVRAFSREVDKK